MYQEMVAVTSKGPMAVLADNHIDVEAAAEEASRAAFAETVARLVFDEKLYVQYQAAKSRNKSKLHVKTVLHHKSQEAIGKRCRP